MHKLIPFLITIFATFGAAGSAHAALARCGDVDSNNEINASDALGALRRAVDENFELDCGPRGRLLRTGQNVCFDAAGAEIECDGSGQEGAVGRGIARDSVDVDNGTVADEVTGLVWEKLSDDDGIHDRDAAFSWQEAFDKIEQLNEQSYGGFDDWRLPNAFELYTLANLGRSDPAYYAAHFDRHCEPECTELECSCTPGSGDSWSSTTYVPEPDHAWLVSAQDGRLFADDKSQEHAVRAVRGGWITSEGEVAAGSAAAITPGSPCGDVDLSHTVTASDALAILRTAVGQESDLRCSPRAETLQTGQTQCYDAAGNVIGCAGTGQDGELRFGAPRDFVDNGDGTVTDLTTGLMWEKLADDGGLHDKDTAYTWSEAITVKIAGLNTAMFAGFENWRLPTIFELVSSLDLGEANPAAYPELSDVDCDDGCAVEQCGCSPSQEFLWSVSTYAPTPSQAWTLSVDDGATQPRDKTMTAGVRAVRGGN